MYYNDIINFEVRKLSNEIVKYDNRLNSIPLGRLNANELNLFITLVQQSQSKGVEEIVLPFKKLQDLSKYQRSTANFVKDLTRVNTKLLSITAITDDGDTITQFPCWDLFQLQRSKQELRVRVNHLFKGLFNDLSQWTRFQLAQFNNLKSAYAKNMFRLLKQYRTVGRLKLSKDEFFKQLDLPESYLKYSYRVQQRVLAPIKEELAPIFRGLSVTTLRGDGKGRPVSGYLFTWHPEANNADDFSKGRYVEKRQMLDNIDLNDNLSAEEKAHAYDRVLGYKLGTTDPKLWENSEKMSITKSEAERQVTEAEWFNGLRELLKTWVQYFPKTNSQTVNKLKDLYNSYGLDAVKKQIKRYASLNNFDIETPKLLEMIESSLSQNQED